MKKFNAKELVILSKIFEEHFGPGTLIGVEPDDIILVMREAFAAGREMERAKWAAPDFHSYPGRKER